MAKNKEASTQAAVAETAGSPAPQPAETSPMAFLFNEMDVSEESPIDWAIDILCNASMAIRYRQIFRAAAEQLGEIGVYRLLSLMVQNTHDTKHNQLFISAIPAISSARLKNTAVKFPDGMKGIPSANAICHAVMTRAAGIRKENERVRKYGDVRIVPR